MSKQSDLPVDEKQVIAAAPQIKRPRRLFTRDNRIPLAFICVIISTLWFSYMLELFPPQYAICRWPLSVQERATIILKKNPLIG
jgi:hypothetical protein